MRNVVESEDEDADASMGGEDEYKQQGKRRKVSAPGNGKFQSKEFVTNSDEFDETNVNYVQAEKAAKHG